MAHVCEICNKGELSGNNVSHSHLKTKRSWKPNIQRVRAIVDGEVKRINVCTRCLRQKLKKGAAAPKWCRSSFCFPCFPDEENPCCSCTANCR